MRPPDTDPEPLRPDPADDPTPPPGPPPAEPSPAADALPAYPRDPGTRPAPGTRSAPVSSPDLPSYPRDPGPRPEAPAPMLEGPELPSYPREDTRPPSRPMSGLQRGLLLVLGVVALLFIAQTITRDRDPGPSGETDAIARAAARAGAVELALSTDDPARARQFVRDEFGWRVGVPVFEGMELQGVGISELAPSVEVPVFLYLEDNRGREVTVFALSYALLDQVPERLRLARGEYERLAADPRPAARRARRADVVVWRDRDDLYLAVTGVPPAQLTRNLSVAR